MELKGTKTEQNLKAAFAGESQAGMKYHYFATAARREKMVHISEIFTESSGHELEHAKMWYKYLKGGVGNTEQNLQDAVDGEHFEWSEMYVTFAREAREEGFEELAQQFEGVAGVEKEHERRFGKLLQNVRAGKVFAREDQQTWMCSTCGNVVTAKEAPETCPVCGHGRAYFRICPENY